MKELKDKKLLLVEESELPAIVKFITRTKKEKRYILKSPAQGEKLLLNKPD